MTKVSVFGQETEKKQGKPIEFVKLMKNNGSFEDVLFAPSKFNNIQLFLKSEFGNFDIILAWIDGRSQEKAVFLGHWNDGFVE